ncbi:MAG TPA: VIT domain-containing protein [Nannocystis sp.]
MPRILSVVALSLVSIASLSCTAKPSRGDIASEPTGECTLEWREPEAQGDVVAPFSLTSSEGIGLELLSLDARAVVDDPLAFTELTMVFRNPEARVIEGRFEITLPPGAAISRFAMKINNDWMEAEVVELQAARRAYEDALHRRQDPALLEKNAGNRFSARVFPIPANGVKEIIVSYSEALASNSEPYRLHLRGLPKLKDLGVDVVVPRASGPEHLGIREKDFMPQKDLELVTARRSAEVGLRYERLAVARVAPDIKLPQEPISGVTLLFDTSASRAVDFKGQVARLGKIIEELRAATGNDFDLRVLCFDQTVEPVFAGKASSFSADAQQAILKRNALGASDLAGALKYVADNPTRHERLIVVSDGIATAGDTERDKLRAAAGALGKAGVRRIDAVVDGGVQDEISLKQITGGNLERDGIVVNARLPAALLASRLVRATRSDLRVRVPGATWVWPETLDAVQPGDQVLIFADLPAGAPMHVELGDTGEGARDVPLKNAERPLLERAWVKANIDRLSAALDTSDAGKAETRKQILDLSIKYRVLSDYTALLVLETEYDYQRFGIDRSALAEILTVGPSGVTTIDRSRLPNKGPGFAGEERSEEERSVLDNLFGDDKARVATRSKGAGAEPPGAPTVEGATGRPAPTDPALDGLPAPAAAMAPGGGGDTGIGGMPERDESIGGAPPRLAAQGAPPPRTPEPMAEAAKDEAEESDDRPSMDAKRKSARPTGARPQQDPFDVPTPRVRPRPIAPRPLQPTPPPPPRPIERPRKTDAYDGRYAIVMSQVDQHNPGGALREAWLWREQSPGDELALLALGEAAEASGDAPLAARAYGSLIDLFPGRADIRRMAGERLEALGPVGLGLAVDTYAQAVQQRPDHPSSHRLYAFALLKAGRHAEAFAAALKGAQQAYPWGRFAGVERILADDLRLIAAAWLAERPMDEKTIRAELGRANVTPDTAPSLRFVLNWETDANDVDFHIYDGQGGHAYYSNRSLPSGGELYADVTTGYGPECFTVPAQASAFPYVLQGHYYSRGPMGYGMGKLEVIEHDGLGHLRFKEHPFVIMKDGSFVDLGTLDGPLAKAGPGARLEPGDHGAAGKPGPAGSYTPPPPVGQPLPPTRF